MRKPGNEWLIWILALGLAGALAGCKKSETPPKTPTEASKTADEGVSDQTETPLEAALEHRSTPAPTVSHEPSASESKSPPGNEAVKPDFDPFLLRHRNQTMQYVVEIPPRKEEAVEEGSPTPTPQPQRLGAQVETKFPEVVKVILKDKTVVRIQVAVECADEETMMALKGSPENQRLVQEAVENRTADELLTLQGKMEFKDDLIRRLKNSLKPEVRGIKDVHLMEFNLNVL
jgi:flagellar basal body-associated protein FliL